MDKKHIIFFAVLAFLIFFVFITPTQKIENDETYIDENYKYNLLREKMVEQQLKERDIVDGSVLNAMLKVPRHLFVPQDMRGSAYEDHASPIGHGQTISQPYIVALMTQELKVDEDDKVLEIGTGYGYQAAVLAELVDEVYTIEIIKELADQAALNLEATGYDVHVRNADGYLGWPDQAPFDAIIVTAAVNHIPQPLLAQLKVGGRLIMPLGDIGKFQTLTLIIKMDVEGNLDTRYITGVVFVPFTGEALVARDKEITN